jgi:hypothetical protein
MDRDITIITEHYLELPEIIYPPIYFYDLDKHIDNGLDYYHAMYNEKQTWGGDFPVEEIRVREV